MSKMAHKLHVWNLQHSKVNLKNWVHLEEIDCIDKTYKYKYVSGVCLLSVLSFHILVMFVVKKEKRKKND